MHIEEDVQRLLSQIQPAGCLQDHLAGFATQLIENNYSVLSARDYARSTAHLGRWMEVVGVEIDELSEELIASSVAINAPVPECGDTVKGLLNAASPAFSDSLCICGTDAWWPRGRRRFLKRSRRRLSAFAPG